MPIYRILRCALLALSLALLAVPSASGEAGDRTRFTGELLRYLGLDPAKRLPELARSLGQGIREFRRSVKEISEDPEGSDSEKKG